MPEALLFAFLVEEGEVTRNPMINVKALAVPEVPVPVLSIEQLDAVLRTCAERDFVSPRTTP